MNPEDAIPLLKSIIMREQKNGCPEASESLIELVLRRWRSYCRRHKNPMEKSLKHLAHDLEKGILEKRPDYGYDPGCIRHLSQSFAMVLMRGSIDEAATSSHAMPR